MTHKPFDYVTSINSTKKNLIEDETTEKGYSPFLTNRALSYHADTILYANEMNLNSGLDNKLQYDYYLYSIKKGKRFSKWHKFEASKEYNLIKDYYKYNDSRTREVLSILSKDQIDIIKKRMYKGDD